MIRMKVGGIILTGVTAFLVAGKAMHTIGETVSNVCEASKWKGYYRCWSKGKTEGSPVPPGYSMTTRPDKANYEVVYDPKGVDHSGDNQPKQEESRDPGASVKAVCEAVKAVADKVVDSLAKRSEAAEGAKEGQTEASVNDISDSAEENFENVISNAFGGDTDGDADITEEKETDQDETVD